MAAIWRRRRYHDDGGVASLDTRDLKSLNAPRTLLLMAANAMAVLIFIAAHAVRWRETLALLIGATIEVTAALRSAGAPRRR